MLKIVQRNAAEQPSRAAAIGLDLRTQRVHIWKRAFVAQPLNERHAQGCAIQIARQIEHVCLDDRTIDIAKRRAHADIGNRRVDDVVDRHGGGIDARRWHELVAGREVRRRKSQLASTTRPTRGRAINEVMVPKKRARFIDSALTHQPPNPRAADHEILVPNRVDLL